MLFDYKIFYLLSLILYIVAFNITVFKVSRQSARTNIKIFAEPKYHGYLVVLFSLVSSVAAVVLFKAIPILAGYSSLKVFFGSSCLAFILGIYYANPKMKAREKFERINKALFQAMCNMTILLTLIIIFVIFVNSWHFFSEIPLHKFLFGTYWNPQAAELSGSKEDSFGILPVLSGTLLITLIALLVAFPFGLTAAIYISEFASTRFRVIAKSLMELLAGIPTVVYGYFAAIFIGPWVRNLGEKMGLDVGSESALAAGIVMGIMIMPYIMTLTDDVISSVPKSLKDAALALGLTRSETVINIVLPVAMPGIFASVLLAVSRAIGETMIVAMAAGLSANMTLNPLKSVTTITVQIVRLLSSDQEFGSVTTSSAFALALTLFVLTFLLNVCSSMIVNKYKNNL